MDIAISTSTVTITGADGAAVEAYAASPVAAGSRGAVVVIHHLPGWDRWTKEVARRFAVDGYDVLCPNLYSREAPGADPDDAAAVARANGGVPDDRLVGDIGGAVSYLRGQASSNSRVAVIGHCSGGRQAVLAAANLDIQGAVDCYGAFVIGTAPPEFPVKMTSLEDQLVNISCPVLGMFGNDDTHPSAVDVAEFDRQLTALGKEHDFHSYDGAGHAFFCTDRPSYRVEAAVEGYQHIDAFFKRVLG
jgi:carboxymethylenebutenolidase